MQEMTEDEREKRIAATNANPWVQLAREGAGVWNGFMRAYMGEKEWLLLLSQLPPNYPVELKESLKNCKPLNKADYERRCNALGYRQGNVVLTADFSSYYSGGKPHDEICFIGCVVPHAYFLLSHFNGTNFEGAIFTGLAAFSGTVFELETQFQNAVFMSDAHFDRAVFNGTANFLHSSFLLPANFQETEFNGIANFEHSNFQDEAEFTQAKFNDFAYFNLTIFQGKAVFTQAFFKDKVLFDEARFHTLVDFERADFRKKTSFATKYFLGDTSFEMAEFHHEVFFEGILFQGYVNFKSAKFYKQTMLSYTQFEEHVDFLDAKFYTTVTFLSDVLFNKRIDFDGAVFQGIAKFYEVQFNEPASFKNCVFERMALFNHGTTFSDGVSFESAQFKNHAEFIGTKFDGKSFFHGVTFNKQASFDGAKFCKVSFVGSEFKFIADFRNTKFELSPHFEGVKCEAFYLEGAEFLPYDSRETLEEASSAWAALVRLTERVHNLPWRQRFHEKLLEVEKEYQTEKSAKILYYIYSLLGSGRSALIPSIWLIFLCTHMTYFYWVFVEKITVVKSLAFSLVSAVPFMTHSKSLIADIPDDIIFQIAGGLHTTASLTLVFLIGLALRNRFRVK